MTDPTRLRDSTEIVLPQDTVEGIRSDIETEFTVTVFQAGEAYRIIGSPVEIKAVGKFLARRGVSLP